MAAGVTLVDPATTYVDVDVEVGAGHRHPPRRASRGPTQDRRGLRDPRGRRASSTPRSAIGVTILDHSLIVDSRSAPAAASGRSRTCGPDSALGEGAQVGNFVELKKTTIGAGAKANHLAYLGDATIGDGVNIGAGTITCNYDGTRKHQTMIGDGAFVGSNSSWSRRSRRRRRLRGGRLGDHRGRARRRAGASARGAAGEQGRLGWRSRKAAEPPRTK